MKKCLLPTISLVIALISLSFVTWKQSFLFDEHTRVNSLLSALGSDSKSHIIAKIDTQKARIGKELVYNGWANVDGKKSKVVSKYFVCTDCHNQVIEDEDLLNPIPETRLLKSVRDKIPFLQGTTFYGMVNRTSWYNEDYVKKYGDLVKPAHDTLENAVQLCAKVCSSGRYLSDWELEAIMHYLNTIDYKLSDLGLTQNEMLVLKDADINIEEKRKLILSKYKHYSSATFLDVVSKKEREYGIHGEPVNGRDIYVQSCMSCHNHEKDFTSLKLDTTQLSLKFLKTYITQNNNFSVYNIVRKGTTAEFAIREYMPHYTAERMSEEQLEDLVSYILR
jgi:Cytochrome C oxidase, cbb3-type, subunit III